MSITTDAAFVGYKGYIGSTMNNLWHVQNKLILSNEVSSWCFAIAV